MISSLILQYSKNNLVDRYRDDDYESDDEILNQGKKYVANELKLIYLII